MVPSFKWLLYEQKTGWKQLGFYSDPIMTAVDVVLWAISTYVAAVLLASGLAKLTARRQFRRTLLQQGLVHASLVPFLGWAIPTTELGVALGLSFGLAPQLMALFALCVFLVFTLATAILLAQGKNVECGCFGVIFRERITLATLIRDMGFVGAAVACLGLHTADRADAGLVLSTVTGFAMLSFAVWVLVAMPLVGAVLFRVRRIPNVGQPALKGRPT
jgi:hypothetical protein